MKNFAILYVPVAFVLLVLLMLDQYVIDPGIIHQYLYLFAIGIILLFVSSYLLITKDTRIAGAYIHFIKKENNPLFFWIFIIFNYFIGILFILIGILDLIA